MSNTDILAEMIERGVKSKHISFDKEKKYITYCQQNKKRSWANPEEKVQAYTYLSLIFDYNYSPERISHFVQVTMGSYTREADIVVYNDDEYESPYIVVECKKEDTSELALEQAVNQAFSYAVAEGAKYVWTTSRIKDIYFEVPLKKPKARVSIPDIPKYGVTKVAAYKYAKGGAKGQEQFFDINVVSEDDLTKIFRQAHQALWGGGELNPSAAFDELDKLIFCKIWDEKKARKKGKPYDFQIITVQGKNDKETTAKTNEALLDRIRKLYEEGRKKDPEVFKEDIRLSAAKLRTVVGYLEGVNIGDTDLDSKGRAFETFMGSFFRGDFGQFFTPRSIVKFIVDVLPITNDSLVLDTSCGSGGFLLHALDKVRRQADEYFDLNTESTKHYKYWHDFAEKNLYGIEINEQIARTAKMNMIIHDDGHTNVVASDGLVSDKELRKNTKNQGFKYGRFDFIITNPPFGSSVKQTERAYLKHYGLATKDIDWLNPKSKASLRPGQSTEILFIEQCYKYLAEGGYLAIVIPDGILTNSSLQYVRDNIDERFRIVAVISMPQTAFQATGAGVKSSVMILKKYDKKATEKIKGVKNELKEQVKQDNDFIEKLQEIDKQKKKHIKNLDGLDNPENLAGKALKDSESYKQWKKEVTDKYNQQIDDLKDDLTESYQDSIRKKADDYNIFMAIAEDIGYDSTGKPTKNNELDIIVPELARFIDAIEKGRE